MSQKLNSLLSDDSPIVMGILNATPDSFSDGGMFDAVPSALDRIHIMIEEGASIIDIGGESTRPNADPVSEKDEIDRVIPILEQAIPVFGDSIIFSIDTTKYEVARRALDLGAEIINDVSGFTKESRFADLSVEFNATYILMHSQGSPQNMQDNPRYDEVIEDLSAFFGSKIIELKKRGVKNIVLDPGIGFGKKLNHNLKIIAELDSFLKFEFPVLVGASRKSMIGQILDGRPADERLIGTVAVHYHSLIKGARILRVHDVREAMDSVRIFNAIQYQS